jgi:hypothetical protein
LSRIRRIGFSGEHLTCFKRCCNDFKKSSDVIQPEGQAKGRKPSGKFIILVRFTLTLGKMKVPGKALPAAFTNANMETFIPCSPPTELLT